MQFHYALVDDLLAKEEFERRVEDKIQECGDLVDEMTAALLVVRDLGREHVKIKDLASKASLFSFFGKVTGKSEPREFDRSDGEKGLVATVSVGDEGGEARIVLWDEKAMAVQEIDTGDVLEIIGKPGKRPGDITVLALRKSSCQIECGSDAAATMRAPPVRLDIDVKLLALDEPKTFTRRDGTTSEMVGAAVGDANGTARLVCWDPGLLDELIPGTTLHITGAVDRSRAPLREYSIDEKSTLELSEVSIDVTPTPVSSVVAGRAYSIKGQVIDVLPWKPFKTKNGSFSSVRNIAVGDGTGTIRVVLWGESAERHFFIGDIVSIFNAVARAGRNGEPELSVGRSSSLVTEMEAGDTPVEFEGTIISGREGTFIDNGTVSYLIEGVHPYGREVRVRGRLTGHTIIPEYVEARELDPEAILERFRNPTRQSSTGPPPETGTPKDTHEDNKSDT
ncbi:MAG TPA: nucleic acid-binding protein [Methanoregulaceae archaeon]|nr:nucleic acid-binding protein [Methanoregulaceae archaeon]